MGEQIENLLHKEVTRKEFLIHFSLVIIALSGAATIISKLLNPIPDGGKKTFSHSHSEGFGSGSYGGIKQSSD